MSLLSTQIVSLIATRSLMSTSPWMTSLTLPQPPATMQHKESCLRTTLKRMRLGNVLMLKDGLTLGLQHVLIIGRVARVVWLRNQSHITISLPQTATLLAQLAVYVVEECGSQSSWNQRGPQIGSHGLDREASLAAQ